MKATGIVRKLDDLGRLVIPKEIRRVYRLKEGDSIEFYVSDTSEIVLKKYSYLNDEKEKISQMIETLKEITRCEVLFFLDDDVIGNDNIVVEDVSSEVNGLIRKHHQNEFEQLRLLKEQEDMMNGTIIPVIVHSHWYGAFMIYQKQGFVSEQAKNAVVVMSVYLTKQFEHE